MLGVLVLIFRFLLVLTSDHYDYYVRNTEMSGNNFSCVLGTLQLHPCGTLGMFESYFTRPSPSINASISMYFVDSHYQVLQNVSFTFASLFKLELVVYGKMNEATITCIEGLSFTLTNVNLLEMNSLLFNNCSRYQATISIVADEANMSRVKMSNISFLKGQFNAVLAACVRFKLSVSHSIFDGHTSIALGVRTSYISSKFENVTFSNNHGGLLLVSISNQESSLVIIGCKFVNNTSDDLASGGLVMNTIFNATVQDSIFSGNRALQGGAIQIHSDLLIHLLITNSTFTNNTANSGGAIYIFRSRVAFRIINSSFAQNSADHGGGMTIEDNFQSGLIKDSIFLENQAYSRRTSGENRGGALFVKHSSIIINKTIFLQNSANDGGGALLLSNNRIQVSDCIFHNNTGIIGGAILIYGSHCEFLGTNFTLNHAKDFGGAFYITNRFSSRNVIDITSSIFNNNSVSKRKLSDLILSSNGVSAGGGIYIEANSQYKNMNNLVYVYNSTFKGNIALIGGAIASSPQFRLAMSLTNTHFLSNYAAMSGGAMASMISDKYNLGISSCTFVANIAYNQGGAIFAMVQRMPVSPQFCLSTHTNTSFKDNSAIDGGALYVFNPSPMSINHQRLAFRSTLFTGNRAVVDPFSCGRLQCFQEPYSTAKGGALAVMGYISDFEISDCSFKKNKAIRGGAVHLFNGVHNTIDIKYCRFINNEACIGGAIYVNATEILSDHLFFQTNQAITMGGAVLMNSSSFNSNGSLIFHGNVAGVDGGALAMIASRISVHGNVAFSNNMAAAGGTGGRGGGVFVLETAGECQPNDCAISWSTSTVFKISNNSALMGPLFYGGMLHLCSDQYSLVNMLNLPVGAITSAPVQICFCPDQAPDCTTKKTHTTRYPGQALDVAVACVDQIEQPVPCYVRNEFPTGHFHLGQGESYTEISNHTCQNLPLRVFSKTHNTSTLHIKGIVLCESNLLDIVAVSIDLLPCPMGFYRADSQCECDPRLAAVFRHAYCNIDNGLIYLNDSGWFGYQDGFLKLHKRCPLNYCSTLMSTGISAVEPDSQCAYNRGGILCGECVANCSAR